MKSAVYLRIASVLTLVHAVLHTIGGVFGAVPPGPASVAAAAMKSNQFMALGMSRNYWEFYRGMGLGVTIFLAVEAVAFWMLASVAKRDAVALRPVLAVFMVGYLALAVNSYLYFFLAPVIVETLIAACLGFACIAAGKQVAERQASTTATVR
jgi:hypothetical protein